MAPRPLASSRDDGPVCRRGAPAGCPGRHACHRDVPRVWLCPRDGLLTPRDTSSRAVVSTLFTLVILSGAYLLVFLPWSVRSELTLMGVTPFVEESALMSYLDVKWLLDFQTPEQRLLDIGLTCLLSVALYASGAFVLALWTLKSFERVIDRPGSRAPRKVLQSAQQAAACEFLSSAGTLSRTSPTEQGSDACLTGRGPDIVKPTPE